MRPTDPLSPREAEVVALLLEGKSNKQIAADLGIADGTVEFHLTNIYAKLQVGSRAEAILKLGKSPGGSIPEEPGKSRVAKMGESAENDEKLILTRRFPMKNLIYLSSVILLLMILLAGPVFSGLRANSVDVSPSPTIGMTQMIATATLTPPAVSPKESILIQIRQLVDEYEQNIQSEKKNGKVKFDKDPQTGEDIFLFQDESYQTVQRLNEKLWEKINPLQTLYAQIYRDEIRPTPFPTQASAEENKAYYDHLDIAASCTSIVQPGDSALKISIYSPDDGKYVHPVFGDPDARCTVFGQMMEEFRVAPLLAKVNKDADRTTIRQIMGKPEMTLVFQSIASFANATGRSAALYVDEAGTNYYVDVETARLDQIEPKFSSHPNIPASEVKSVDELRGIASQFALTNSPRLAALKPVLTYEEGGKVSIYFFTWRYNSRDWRGTDWAMMPPFIQVGVLSNGEIATYINTLDLFKE